MNFGETKHSLFLLGSLVEEQKASHLSVSAATFRETTQDSIQFTDLRKTLVWTRHPAKFVWVFNLYFCIHSCGVFLKKRYKNALGARMPLGTCTTFFFLHKRAWSGTISRSEAWLKRNSLDSKVKRDGEPCPQLCREGQRSEPRCFAEMDQSSQTEDREEHTYSPLNHPSWDY